MGAEDEREVDEDFGASYPALFRELTALFRSRGLQSEEAGDFAQETVVRTFVHLKRHGRTQPDLRPLAHTIARRLYVERGRRVRPRFVELPEAEHLADPTPQPADQLVTLEERQDVRDALRSLTPRHRRVVSLWMSGLRPAEIARELGIKRNAADALLHRARRQLATRLDPSRATLGIVGLIVFRLRAGARRLLDAVTSLDPTGSVASAASGLAVGIAVLIAASPGASTHATLTPRDAMPRVASLASHELPVARTSSDALSAPQSLRSSGLDVREYRFGSGAQVRNPATGQPDDVGLELWYFRDDDPNVIDKVVEPAAQIACKFGVVGCAPK